ncbi:MAG TPA: RIO1 family regulatory kinase/ATPase [Methanoregulaceae archaeon]|nr:RIO1 family regulatory kinase/ATPase [Methanoregulaceae archaeon]HRY75493.1 RIO1 family regulatory kinase/ATPase [Methanoregulaceae archaeon]
MPIPAEKIRTLHKYELRILTVLERLMKRYAWVPEEQVRHAAELSESETAYRISRLMEFGMVRYNTVPYDGYSLVFTGYDTLALHALVKKGTISAIGSLIGEGKESVVYEALGLCPVAIKFHRVGQRSFSAARSKREYMPGEGHVPWIFASRLSAEREFAALTALQETVSVPLPIGCNRHAVVMSLITGLNLNRCPLEDPEAMLDAILANVRSAYKAGVIHADLSEFNIMIQDGKPVIIDWPQWIETGHPNAEGILQKDLTTILTFFKRKYHISSTPEDALRCVTG